MIGNLFEGHYRIDRIVQFRAQLMGIAIFWIMLFHSGMDFGQLKILYPVKFIFFQGYSGVDLFFFLSGFGVLYSFYKAPNLRHFYRRRLSRILPVFYLFGFIQLMINGIRKYEEEVDLGFILSHFFPMDFIRGEGWVHWFIIAIILSYLIFPLVKFLLDRQRFAYFFSAILVGVYGLTLVLPHINKELYNIYLLRLPSFILGAYCADLLISGKEENPWFTRKWVVCALFAASLVFYAFMLLYVDYGLRLKYGLWWYPSVALSYSSVLLLSNALSFLEEKQLLSRLITSLGILGGISLELYFVHGMVFDLRDHIARIENLPLMNIIWCLAIAVSIGIALLFKKIDPPKKLTMLLWRREAVGH